MPHQDVNRRNYVSRFQRRCRSSLRAAKVRSSKLVPTLVLKKPLHLATIFRLATVLTLAVFGTGQELLAVTKATCIVHEVGWREDLKALKIHCTSGEHFWAPATDANPQCAYRASYDAIKMWQASANASLLSGKPLSIWYETQSGCNTTDKVPREIYLYR